MKIMISAVFAILLMSGCSHKISMTPPLDELRKVNVENKVNVNVGYYLSDDTKK